MYKYKGTGETDKNLTLKDMLATNKFASYGTESLEEYTAQIKKMNLSDLHYHAIKLGIRPHSDRRRMEKLLAQEFNRTKSSYLAACNQSSEVVQSKEKLDKQQKALEILRSTK
jgi:hypothetical protein